MRLVSPVPKNNFLYNQFVDRVGLEYTQAGGIYPLNSSVDSPVQSSDYFMYVKHVSVLVECLTVQTVPRRSRMQLLFDPDTGYRVMMSVEIPVQAAGDVFSFTQALNLYIPQTKRCRMLMFTTGVGGSFDIEFTTHIEVYTNAT